VSVVICTGPSGKPEKYLTRLAGLFPAYSENKPVKNGDHGITAIFITIGGSAQRLFIPFV